MEHVLIVSPHRDDAAFSCGITIRKLATDFLVTAANLFTVSEYAPFRAPGSVPVTELRFFEDQAFSKITNCSLNDLPLIDAPQRLSIQMSDIASNRPFNHTDEPVIKEICNHIRALKPDLLILPLGLGDHIDHRIARAGGLKAGISSVAFYEDLPYAARMPESAPASEAASLGLNLYPVIISAPDGAQWKARCAALYPSQIEEGTVQEIAGYSVRYQNGERLWVTPHAATWLHAAA